MKILLHLLSIVAGKRRQAVVAVFRQIRHYYLYTMRYISQYLFQRHYYR